MDFEDPRESKTLCPLDGHRLGPKEASCCHKHGVRRKCNISANSKG